MKSLVTLIAILFTFSYCTAGCSKNDDIVPTQKYSIGNNNPSTAKMKITIGTAIFTATLYDNPSATAFRAMFPLSINMTELNNTRNITIYPPIYPPMHR